MEGESGKHKLRLVTLTLCQQLPALGRERMCPALGTHYVPVFASGSFSYSISFKPPRLSLFPIKRQLTSKSKANGQKRQDLNPLPDFSETISQPGRSGKGGW